MTTELTQANKETLEAVISKGDLSRLTGEQRIWWYRQRCEGAGLDWRTQPFGYIKTRDGGTQLYANSTAAQQLGSRDKLSSRIMAQGPLGDLYQVQVRVTGPDGRETDDEALVPYKGLTGEQAANAVMKCITKARRRAILAHCGLGTPEDDMDTVPGAQTIRVDVATGEILPSTPQLPPGESAGTPSYEETKRDRDEILEREQRHRGVIIANTENWLRDHHINPARECRLYIATKLLKKTVNSYNELEPQEATHVLNLLDNLSFESVANLQRKYPMPTEIPAEEDANPFDTITTDTEPAANVGPGH